MIEIIVTGIVYLVYGLVCFWIGYDTGIKREKEKSGIDEITKALAKQSKYDDNWRMQQQKEMMDRQEIMCGRKPRRKREIKIVN